MYTNKSIEYMYLHKSTWGTGESFSSEGHLTMYQLHIGETTLQQKQWQFVRKLVLLLHTIFI